MNVGTDVIRHGDVARGVPRAEPRAVALRRQRVDLVLEGRARRRGRLRCQQSDHIVRRRGEGILRVTDADDRFVEARLAIVIDAQARLDVQRIGQRPVQLAEHREAGVVEVDRVRRRQAVQHIGIGRVIARQQEPARRRSLHLRPLGIDRLVKKEGANRIVQPVGAIGGEPQLLRHLFLLRRVLRHGGDRQADEIAIVLRLPVPVAPRADRGQRRRPQIPIADQRDAADLLPRIDRRIQVGHAIERIGAGRPIIERRGERRILPRDRPLRGADAGVILHAAERILHVVIARQREVQAVARIPQQLSPHAIVVEPVQVAPRGDVINCALALRRRRGQAQRDPIRQRARYRRLGLDEFVIAGGQLDPRLGGEAWRPGRDIQRARRRVLAVQRALRPAQHLHPLDIDEVEGRGTDPPDVHAIDVEADALFDPVVGQAEWCAEPPDVDRRIARVARIELQRGLLLLQAVDVERARLVELGTADHRDRDRHPLHRFGAAARGDDDVGGTRRGGCTLRRAGVVLCGSAFGCRHGLGRRLRHGLAGKQHGKRQRHRKLPFIVAAKLPRIAGITKMEKLGAAIAGLRALNSLTNFFRPTPS